MQQLGAATLASASRICTWMAPWGWPRCRVDRIGMRFPGPAMLSIQRSTMFR